MRRTVFGRTKKPAFLNKMVAHFPFNTTLLDVVEPVYGASQPTGTVNLNTGKFGLAAFVPAGTNSLRYQNTLGNTKFRMYDLVGDVPFSFSLWIYISSYNTESHIFGYNGLGGSGNNHAYAMFLTSAGRLKFTKYSEGVRVNSINAETTSILPTGQWIHVVYVDNIGTNMKIYINGSLVTTTISTTGSGFTKMSDGNARFGFFNTQGVANSGGTFIGGIDDFGAFKDALKQSDIDLIYNAGIGKELK